MNSRLKETTLQAEEEKKNNEKNSSLIDSLQQKIKTYKRQVEEAVSDKFSKFNFDLLM